MNTERSKPEIWRVIIASSVGTLFEWYDFYIYGALASLLGELFFPQTHPTAGLLASLATFGAGFAVRPLGALFFGRLGDKLGRKKTFLVTILMMGAATALIGVLPTYERVGIVAPCMLVLLRFVQGFALGGEYGGAAIYVAEHAPDHRRGFYTSFIQSTVGFGFLCSLIVVVGTRTMLGERAFREWGWRLPFIASFILLIISTYIRLKLEESPVFEQMRKQGVLSKHPIKESFTHKANLKLVLTALFGVTAAMGAVWYAANFYALVYLEKTLRLSSTATYTLMTLGLLISTPLVLWFGHLSDRYGPKRFIVSAALLAAFTFVPLFRTMYTASLGNEPNYVIIGVCLLVAMVYGSMIYAPVAALLVDMFPPHIRYTSLSLPYHIGSGFFGGFTPFIATALTAWTGVPYAGLFYPSAVALVAAIVAWRYVVDRTSRGLVA